MSKLNCSDRIKDAWKSRKSDLKKCLYDPSEEHDICEYGLDFTYVPKEGKSKDYFRYQLSWGGPSDELRMYEGSKTVYVFMDWFDGAELKVSKSGVIKDLRDWFDESGLLDFQSKRDQDGYS